jgi:hypothetical protein
MKQQSKAKKTSLPRGRRPLPEGTAVTATTSISTTIPFHNALVEVARRENRSRSAVVVEALREKYPGDFDGL